MRRILRSLLCLTFLLALLPLPQTLGAERVIHLRIEGIEGCLYSQTFVNRTDNPSISAALTALTESNAALTIQGLDGETITAVNNETVKHSGGGWHILVGSKPATLATPLTDGDNVVIYYGAPDTLRPQPDESRMIDGLLRFTQNGEPVEGITVTLKNTRNNKTLTTNSDGYVDLSDLTGGEYHMQIAKTNTAGLPLALRLPENTKLRIEGDAFLQGTNIFALVVCIALGLGVTILFLVYSEKKRKN